jgi:hypothetical protein
MGRDGIAYSSSHTEKGIIAAWLADDDDEMTKLTAENNGLAGSRCLPLPVTKKRRGGDERARSRSDGGQLLGWLRCGQVGQIARSIWRIGVG